MANGRKKLKRKASPAKRNRFRRQYREACRLAESGKYACARQLYEELSASVPEKRLRALITNDLAALALVDGDALAARGGIEAALAIDDQCAVARSNLALLDEDFPKWQPPEESAQETAAPPPMEAPPPVRVAILSFLFNWPSTGGGIIHTVELAQFLAQAGYAVRHFHARYAPWDIGRVDGSLPIASEALEFDDATWNVWAIQERFRQAVDAFRPDYVLITDTWNMKPHLAEAVRGYPTLLRFQALECLCPLNNVRLLVDGPNRFAQCPRHQLATPRDCAACLAERGRQSGGLHQAERQLAGVGTPEYHETLCRALREAEAVLVLNPFTEALLSPYCRRVLVVPWGMDPARFPWPGPDPKAADGDKKTIFQAGVVSEYMKGFHILRQACARLWEKRQDFELVATAEPAGRVDAFTRLAGWISQEELPRLYHAADIVAVPTIAQEGLSRTSVEAMAAGKPVVASRIGGLPFTVADGATGLLCEPGNVEELAGKLEMLLDDAELRRRMGRAGRRRFEAEFTWPGVIDRHYRPLLSGKRKED